jgi:general secretion pathway protein I
MKKKNTDNHGFSLLEVLVSLFICTISIWAAIKGINNLTRNFSDIESAIYASWSAENLLIEEELKKYGFQNKKNNMSCDQGNKKLICSKSYLKTPNPNFIRVKIVISDDKKKQLLLINKLLNLNEVK